MNKRSDEKSTYLKVLQRDPSLLRGMNGKIWKMASERCAELLKSKVQWVRPLQRESLISV